MVLHVARRLAHLEHARDHAAHAHAPRNQGGHLWTPPGARAQHEYQYPHSLVEQYAWALTHALRSRAIVMRSVWRLHINNKSMNSGRIRPGHRDHILTSSGPDHKPEVLSVVKSTTLRGDLDSVTPRFPRESARESTWVFGHAFQWGPGSIHLITHPFRRGREAMRLPVATKLEEYNGHPLVHVQEPVMADHRCAASIQHCVPLRQKQFSDID